MSSVTLRDRRVVAKPAGTALLENHRLAFTLPSKRWTGRAADIRPAPGVGVWGVLWEMAEPTPSILSNFATTVLRSMSFRSRWDGPASPNGRLLQGQARAQSCRRGTTCARVPAQNDRGRDRCRAARLLHRFPPQPRLRLYPAREVRRGTGCREVASGWVDSTMRTSGRSSHFQMRWASSANATVSGTRCGEAATAAVVVSGG